VCNGHSRSFKVTYFGTNQQLVCELLFGINGNLGWKINVVIVVIVLYCTARSLHSSNTNLLSVSWVYKNFAYHGFTLLLPQSGTHSLPTFAFDRHHMPSIIFLKPNVWNRPLVPTSLGFGLWLTMCYKGFYLLTYLLSYLLTYLVTHLHLCYI